MHEFPELQTCADHGFVLSPEGTCVRCRSLAAQSAARGRVAKLVTGGVFAVTLLGVGGAYARARSADAPRPAPTPIATVGEAPPEAPSGVSRVEVAETAQASRDALHAWQLELAKAEAARAAELAAAAEAEKRQRRAAFDDTPTRLPVASRGQLRGQDMPNSEDHPAWWQDTSGARRRGYGTLAQQQRAMAAAGVAPYNVANPAAWLAPNNGGNFTTRH